MYRVEIWFDNSILVDSFIVDSYAKAERYQIDNSDDHTNIYIVKV